MDIAVVTGASSGLGLAISRRLLDIGFRVYGLGGNYNDLPFNNVDFRPISCDLADPAQVELRAREILETEKAVSVLVNNAKYFPPDWLGDGAPAEFSRCLNINLLAPLVLVRYFMEGLQRGQGCVINISPSSPETSRGGPIGAASAGGLRWAQEVLFQQMRESGVSVSTVSPEPNRWRPEDAPPAAKDRPQSAIDPNAVADAVSMIVQGGRANVVTEVVLRPERLVERSIPPVREIPYPKPKPIPYTVPRELIEAEERLEREEEDRELNSEGAEASGGRRNRRRRRRRGRGGDRPSEGIGEKVESVEKSEPVVEAERKTVDTPVEGRRETEASDNDSSSQGSGRRKRRRGRGRGRPERDNQVRREELRPGPVEIVRKEATPAASKEDVPKADVGERPPEVKKEKSSEPVSSAEQPPEKAARKAVRKGAKKALKKQAARKTPAKKSVAEEGDSAKKAVPRKAAARKTATKKVARKRVAKKVADKSSSE